MKYLEEVAEECRKEAKEWFDSAPKKHMFSDCGNLVKCIVAEYLANKRGCTIYTLYQCEKDGYHTWEHWQCKHCGVHEKV